ncbi:RNA polymerase sigma-70 factor [Bacteroides faecalis]|uniref:DNA-directed RNA polymerase sigma-70 factor n=1 Tax=Bacteroides faecalis TaxID=2447885 RepID=A0A401LWH9_9BACE|nr:RNA polymerase sigma-70 factor [Bacteroides faecalis]GCB35875.1 DNA-directed RNA polymerase sigma-70 factor [Bacteroides faecalis]
MEDRTEFDRMFKEWFARLFFFANHYLQDTEASRDIVHDAFEYVWRNYEKMDSATVKAYLYSIVRSRCIDYIRQQNAQEDYAEFVLKMTQDDTDTEDRLLWEERMMRIRKAMNKLTPLTRHVLERCYNSRKSYKEVADELNISVSSVHKHIVKALRVIREEIKNESPER